MRIAASTNYIKTYVPPVPAVPLSPEASKTLIASGVFDHNPNQVVWAAPGRAAGIGTPIASAASAHLADGLSFQPRNLEPRSDDSLLTVLRDVGKQALPFMEQGDTHGVADGIALLVATPDILHSLAGRTAGKKEKFLLYGTSIVSLLSIANQFAQVPHADTSLEVVATIFKVGEQVFISGEKEAARFDVGR